jgi:hypothetical protein
MPRHRFRALLTAEPQTPAAPTGLMSRGFVACPAALLPAMGGGLQPWQQQLYQWAYQEAQAVVRPSLLESRLAPVWN